MSAARYSALVLSFAVPLLITCGFGGWETSSDENLFLLHALEQTYTSFPTIGTADPKRLANWLTRTRGRVASLRDSIRSNELDPDIGRLYEECLDFLDAYQSYLVSIGVATDSAEQREGPDLILSVFAGLRKGSEAERRALRRRESGDQLSWAELDSSILGPGERLAASRGQASVGHGSSGEDEKATLRAAWNDTKASAEGTARKLTAKYGWDTDDEGFKGPRRVSRSDDREGRWRNPFAMTRFAATRSASDTPTDLLEKARMCIAAADQVPSGTMYDPFRADFLREAAILGVRATVKELRPFAYRWGPAPSAPVAVSLSELYLAANPNDPSRDGHMLLSHALASAGRYADAIRAANTAREPWSRDPDFCYRYAKLMSLTYQLDLAGNWLGQAYDAGFHDVDAVRGDADLVSFRAGHPELFTHFTDVRWTFKVEWDQPRDDIVVTNKSPFALTNVIIDIYVRQGSRTWEPVIRRDVLQPWESYTAHDVMSVPGGRHDEATGVMFCDQDP